MSPRRPTETDESQVVPPEPMPSDAEGLSEVVERRFKFLLTACTDSKDLTAALKAATDFLKVKGEIDAAGANWGAGLRRTMQ